jgi:hypothetical protein
MSAEVRELFGVNERIDAKLMAVARIPLHTDMDIDGVLLGDNAHIVSRNSRYAAVMVARVALGMDVDPLTSCEECGLMSVVCPDCVA